MEDGSTHGPWRHAVPQDGLCETKMNIIINPTNTAQRMKEAQDAFLTSCEMGMIPRVLIDGTFRAIESAKNIGANCNDLEYDLRWFDTNLEGVLEFIQAFRLNGDIYMDFDTFRSAVNTLCYQHFDNNLEEIVQLNRNTLQQCLHLAFNLRKRGML